LTLIFQNKWRKKPFLKFANLKFSKQSICSTAALSGLILS
jgi:hypothetical protein